MQKKKKRWQIIRDVIFDHFSDEITTITIILVTVSVFLIPIYVLSLLPDRWITFIISFLFVILVLMVIGYYLLKLKNIIKEIKEELEENNKDKGGL